MHRHLAVVLVAFWFSACGVVAESEGPAHTGSRSQASFVYPHWFYTCGAPICEVEGGASTGIRACGPGEEAGQLCDVYGDECDPGVGCGVRLRCTERDPREHGCPISREKYKQEVQYLSSEDLQRYHKELLTLPLATYRYRDGFADARKHLGFMIDGHESLICVEAERDMVDVYGYTSMAVAALKVQAKQIEELQRQVHTLQRRLVPRHAWAQ